MAISREEVFRKALGLDDSDRTELVGLLIESLDPETEQGAEAAWLQEIDRRARELDSGTVQTIPWEIARERLLRAPRDLQAPGSPPSSRGG
jgi:putative addiction module component (TIGR02574 family)